LFILLYVLNSHPLPKEGSWDYQMRLNHKMTFW
jgi:hypothetical protein